MSKINFNHPKTTHWLVPTDVVTVENVVRTITQIIAEQTMDGRRFRRATSGGNGHWIIDRPTIKSDESAQILLQLFCLPNAAPMSSTLIVIEGLENFNGLRDVLKILGFFLSSVDRPAV